LDLLDPFHREQIRGVFAIGTIASIVALRDRIDVGTSYFGIRIVPLLDILLGAWVFYVFLMAIGVSEDLFPKVFSRFCVGVARMMFFLGVGLLLIIVIPLVLIQAYNWLLSGPREVLLALFLVFLYVVARAMKARKSKPTGQPQPKRQDYA